MRIPYRSVFALALALAVPAGAGCSGDSIDTTSGVGGAPDPSSGDFQGDVVSVGFVSTGGGIFVPPGVWMNRYGDADDQHASALASNVTGEIAVVGTVKGTIDFGNIPWTGSDTDTDVVVAKISNEGQSLWSRRYGDSCDQIGGATALAPSGNVVIAGYFCGKMKFGLTSVEANAGETDAFVAMIDNFGEDVYSRRFGGAGAQIARGVAVDAKGNTVLVGSFDQAFDDGTGETPSTGMDDAFVVKLDPKGNVLWSLSFGGPESDLARSVAVDATGNLVIGGTFGGSVDFGGGPLTATAGHSSGFVLELDPNGKHLWSQSFVGDDDTVVAAVAVGPTGNIVATGYFKGTGDLGGDPSTSAGAEDAFLTMMDDTGKRAWSRAFGGPAVQRATGVVFGVNGDVIISGTSNETIVLGQLLGPSIAVTLPFTSLGPNMIYGVRFDALGTPLTGQILDSAYEIESVGVGLDEKFGMILAGSFQGEMSYQFGPVTSAGGWDLFITRNW